MVQMFVRVSVEDYGTFRKTFDEKEPMRQSAGATGHAVYQSVDDPNEVTIRVEFPTAEAATAFASSEALREAMKQAGVATPPTIWFVNES
jgi:heme-degrading monooxygenase HmoA